MQAWRQGVLGLWRQPHLQVKVQLLPVEQQQDRDALLAMGTALERRLGGDRAVRAEGSDLGMSASLFRSDGVERELEALLARWELPRGEIKPHSSFGDALNLLLLGRIVDESPKASD
jgi:hypothetical protein